MEFMYYLHNGTVPFPMIISQQTGKFADVLNNILVFFLVIYRDRKENEEVKDFHEPIFRQLFYIVGGIVFSRNLLWILLAMSSHRFFEVIYSSLLLFLGSLDNFLVNITLMLTFLAALQRIVIMYRPKWKYFMIGKPLTWLIAASWLLTLVLFILKSAAILPKENFSLITTVTISFRLLFFFFTIASNLIYHHFYKLMSNFTDQHQYHRMHLLYQFVPIHTILTIFTFTQLIMEFVMFRIENNSLLGKIYLYAGVFLTPFIPTVISLSYIASRDNLRALITSVMRPIWQDITG